MQAQDIPFGYCRCGCGETTKIARHDRPERGSIKGQPLKYIFGHSLRTSWEGRPIADRLWEKVNKNGPIPEYAPHLGPCWVWIASLDRHGYGQLNAGGESGGIRRAHRVAYELLVGPIPDGLDLDHLCRVRRCVNPAHLEPVTNAENKRRSRRTHCREGHPLSGPNLYINPASGARTCRKCRRIKENAWRAAKRPSGS